MKKIIWLIVLVFAIWIFGYSDVNASRWLQRTNDYVSWIDVAWTDDTENTDPEALYIVIKVINRILSLTSVVAIIVFLIWWYKVLTAWWDDSKAKTWYKFIKNAIIWLIIIWLTRATVRLIFWFVNWMGWDHNFDTSWW